MNLQEHKASLKAILKRFSEAGDVVGSSILTEEATVGKKIPANHLKKIANWTREEIAPEFLHTYPVLMIDTAPTRNNVIYTEKSQKKSVKGWQGVTYLFNDIGGAGGSWFQADHTLQAASQKARIYDSRIVSTPKGEIGSLAWFYAVEGIDEATNSFIKKLDAGILREVSIHVTVPEGVTCSICEAPFADCEKNSGAWHWPGDKYGKKTCYMSTGEGLLVPLELSSVACPGSVNAHVMKDDDVENYPVVSLREALGGSRQALYSLSREADVKKTKEQIAEELKRVQEMATAAGLTLAEAADSIGMKLTEAKKCSECGHESHGNKECKVEECECTGSSKQSAKKDDEEKEDDESDKDDDEKEDDEASDPPEGDDDTKNKKNKKNKKTDKQNVKPKFSLFEGECVACGRSEAAAPVSVNETEALKEMRSDFQEQVKKIVARAREKCESVEATATLNAEKAAHFDKFFDAFVSETADLAIAAGHKKSCDKQAYHEHLKSLSYQAVQELHDVFKLKPVDKATERARLEQSMVDRAKDNLGRTQIVEEKDGTKRTKTERRAFFAAK